MSINSMLKNALKSIAPVQAGDYEPPEDKPDETYITFNHNSYPDDFADDEPGHEVYSVQVHLFCKSGLNSLAMRKKIKSGLKKAGFTYPKAIDVSDRDGQHHVFECMITTEIEE